MQDDDFITCCCLFKERYHHWQKILQKKALFLCRSQWNPDTAVHEGKVVSEQELTALLQPLLTQNSRNLVLFLQDRVRKPFFFLTNIELKSVPKWDTMAPSHQPTLFVFQLSIDDFTYFSESYGNKNPFQNVQASIYLIFFFMHSI